MKKIIFLLILFFIISHPVSAHILKTSGTIGAVLHIDPSDDPIVGEPATFFFEFKDTTGKFKPENCECTFSILENGKEIYSQPLSNTIDFIFPRKGAYKLRVSGKSFELNYDIRVERQVENKQTSQNLVILGAITILIFIIIFAIKHKRAAEATLET